MGRVALVTGGSRGIGAAISKALKDAGYTVAANYAGNDEAAKKFTDETGIKTYKWSVADYDACAAGIKQVEADLGPVEVLVNNAGITRDAMFHRMTPAAVEGGHRHQPDRRLQHDARGLGGHARPQVRPRRHHLLDQRPEGPGGPGELLGAKAGDLGFTKALAQEGARAGITVNAIAPATSPPRWSGDRREGAEREDHPADPGRPARRARGDRADRGLPRLRRRRLHHRIDGLGERRPVLRLTRARAPRRGVPSGFSGRARSGRERPGRAG